MMSNILFAVLVIIVLMIIMLAIGVRRMETRSNKKIEGGGERLEEKE